MGFNTTYFLKLDKYNFKDYLEIGCDKNQSFSKIKIDNKIGVDPIEGGTNTDQLAINSLIKTKIIFVGFEYYHL